VIVHAWVYHPAIRAFMCGRCGFVAPAAHANAVQVVDLNWAAGDCKNG